jgi:hypothetical protein
MSTSEPRYALGRRERRGAILGWRPGQALAVALGAIVLVVGVQAGGTGVAVGIVSACCGAVVAVVPVRGRGVDEWIPVLVAFVSRVRGGSLCSAACVPEGTAGPAHVRWPDGRATVVARLSHVGLRALDDEPAAFAEAVATWLRGLGQGTSARSTVTLLGCGGSRSPSRDAPWADAGIRSFDLLAVTADEPEEFCGALAAVGATGAVTLGGPELEAMFSGRVAPAVGSLLDCEFVARWHHLEGPASVHAAFFVDEFGSGAVDEQALAPLFLSADRRTVAVSIGVESPQRARARAARLRTSSAADHAVTSSGGFLATAEASRDDARDAERAAELAAGHGSLRVVVVVGIDASDPLELEAAAVRLRDDATSCGVKLRRCDGDHRRGVLATIPGWCVP